uniref:FMRFamide-related neuropeptides-like n=1 Tax=Heterorhabditis bacteriophora TaxID=37862 RepID=A0A1I7WV87_HETBA
MLARYFLSLCILFISLKLSTEEQMVPDRLWGQLYKQLPYTLPNDSEGVDDDDGFYRTFRSATNGKPTFIRFGKRAQPSFIRFGRAQPSFIRFGKREDTIQTNN